MARAQDKNVSPVLNKQGKNRATSIVKIVRSFVNSHFLFLSIASQCNLNVRLFRGVFYISLQKKKKFSVLILSRDQIKKPNNNYNNNRKK